MQEFHAYCEDLWASWLGGWRPLNSTALHGQFDLEAAPEPYLLFGSSDNPLTILTTNPGQTMKHQMACAIRAGNGVITSKMTYAMCAQKLGYYYKQTLSGPALQRILAQEKLAMKAGYSGVIQVECCPWHSKALPGKDRFLRLMKQDDHLLTYVKQLKNYISNRAVLGLSAVSTNTLLNTEEIKYNAWLKWQAELLGVDLDSAEVVPLTSKNERVTSAVVRATISQVPRSLVLMMGGNHFPAESNLGRLVEAIQSSRLSAFD